MNWNRLGNDPCGFWTNITVNSNTVPSNHVWFCFREVLASEELLDMANRADWRDCKMTREEETELTKNFRSVFEPFDFTL